LVAALVELQRLLTISWLWFAAAADACTLAALCLLLCRLALCVQVYLKMDRPDKAEQQAKVRQPV
jgi:hypothetical protein